MNTTAPVIPAVQQSPGPHAASSSALSSLASFLNPASAQALDSVQTVTEPAPTQPTEATPAKAPETTTIEKPAPTSPAEPLKKGFDGLETEPEKTPEADAAAESDLPPDATTPAAKNAWSAIKNEVKALKTEKETWEAEKARLAAEAAKAKQFTEADPEWQKYQAAQKRLEELEPVVARVAYTKTQAYKEAVEVPRNEIGVAAQQLAEQFKITEAKMVAALTEPDATRQSELLDEISAEMDSRSRSRLFRMADDLDNLARLDERMASNAEAAAREADAIEAQRREQANIERKAAEMRAVENSRTKLLKATALFKQEGETDEVAVESVLKMAQETPFDDQSVDEKTFAVIAAGLVPRMSRTISALKKQIADRDAEIAAMSNSSPRAGNATTGNTAPLTGAPTDFVSALSSTLANAGIRV